MTNNQTRKPRHIALYLPNFNGGGAERTVLNLARYLLACGNRIDLVVNEYRGDYLDAVPGAARVVALEKRSRKRARRAAIRTFLFQEPWLIVLIRRSNRAPLLLEYVDSLAEYLDSDHPDVLIAALFQCNLVSTIASSLAHVNTRLILTEHNTLSQYIKDRMHDPNNEQNWPVLPSLIQRLYPKSDAIVGVSNGASDDLATTANLPRAAIRTIFNPVVDERMIDESTAISHDPTHAKPPEHFILAIGRLTTAKNFSLLIEAFSRVATSRVLRLIILGDGPERDALEAQVETLGLTGQVSLPGWQRDPYAYMRAAEMLVASSRFEGLPCVLIEAMACGCPVVSTDCPNGPAEILDHGRLGELIELDDPDELAAAINRTLLKVRDTERSKNRARDFSVDQRGLEYLNLIDYLLTCETD